MKNNWLGKTLFVILIVGLLVVGGYAVYRVGYAQGVRASISGDASSVWAEHFENMPNDAWHTQRSMMPNSNRSQMDGYSSMPFSSHNTFGMTGFFFLPALFRVLFWGFVIWLVYKLVTGGFSGGRGWHLSLTRDPVSAPVVDETPIEEA